ncbi:nSTAND3 domain-containing NTPase [Elizabethkingia miricola]|uniref:Restriction endonuclease n=1 Tax=Elizabethkingia miricola TaxID=172045 RepID=A0ABD5BB47_ELIMR|nr:restriction endonuclease [Elizabethkingia miricola]MDQ8750637.1 restriction endonuclease [Elizabethkingia miricola]
MSNYDFSTLNDKEFEEIARDLLNAKYGLALQNFKVGRDKGIDLRFSTSENNNSIVVQVKHYANSTYAQLKHTIHKKELPKVEKLNPNRYIVVTSMSLSATEKDELRNILSPYVITSNDIIGREDLNSYLVEFNQIEKKYFKLWFSSIDVFNAVINNAIEGRTRYLLEKIQKKIPFYVITQKLDEANKILQKEKLLLITGQPGIGKTTLAEIILFQRAKNDYKIYKVESITEAEEVLTQNNEEKQLFYFDDFLGANYYEIVNAQKTETQLTAFVERVKNTPNKYLILTTRTVILNHAIEKYEKISHSRLSNQQFEIKLNDYTKYEKALILYNHIYFREVKEDLYDSILEGKFYKRIIEHKNYTPRIIEFITDNTRIGNLNKDTYLQFILNNLNNPKEIWRYSYNNQIGYLDRCLLLTIFTFENKVLETLLIKAFESRLSYEKKEHNQIINTNQFHDSVKILLNGFISSRLYTDFAREYAFINPSLTDFLIGHVSDSYSERKAIISSIVYIEQLNRFNPEKLIVPLEKELQTIIRDKIAKSEIQILESNESFSSENKGHAIFMETLCKYCNQVNIDTLVLEHFKQISFSSNWYHISQKIEYVLLNLNDAPLTISYIKKNFKSIIKNMASAIIDSDSAMQIPIFFEKYDQDYDEYTKSDEGSENLIELIESVLQYSQESLMEDKKDEVKSIDDVSYYYEDIYSQKEELRSSLFPNTHFIYDFGIMIEDSFWNQRIKENLAREEEENNEEFDEDYYRDFKFNSSSDDNVIDELFQKGE